VQTPVRPTSSGSTELAWDLVAGSPSSPSAAPALTRRPTRRTGRFTITDAAPVPTEATSSAQLSEPLEDANVPSPLAGANTIQLVSPASAEKVVRVDVEPTEPPKAESVGPGDSADGASLLPQELPEPRFPDAAPEHTAEPDPPSELPTAVEDARPKPRRVHFDNSLPPDNKRRPSAEPPALAWKSRSPARQVRLAH
jgi:hypothetical protein